MTPSEWVRTRIEALAKNHPLVWVEDPYSLLDAQDAESLRASLASQHTAFGLVRNALRLREFLVDFDAASSRPRFVLVDQSYTPRDPHALPRDTRPADLMPLPAPDWKPFVPPEARFRPTVRDFLVEATGFDDWPVEVNIYPYERLARERPLDFVRAYETFRAMGRSLTTDDLVLVGASAVLGIDLFDLSDAIVVLDLAYHRPEAWKALEGLFNAREREVIQAHLRSLPPPLGELFGDGAPAGRAAVAGLLVLKQHFPESAGETLALAHPSLARYRTCDLPAAGQVPPWFLSDEVPRFEALCSADFLGHVKQSLGLADSASARAFGQRERLSGKLRSLAAFEIERPPLVLGAERDPFRLEHLVPEFTQVRGELLGIVTKTRRSIEALRLKQPRALEVAHFLKLYADEGFYRVDRLLGRLETLMYYVEGPSRGNWATIPGFAARWEPEVAECRELMTTAERLRDELDYNFGRFLEERYPEVVPEQVLPADLFYERFMAPRRRQTDGTLGRAVVLVIDSMRLDIWRELVRPALEQDYEVEEQLGFALLPTETHVSRRAFFSGKPPGAIGPGPETELFAGLASRVHGVSVEFERLERVPPGMAFGVRSRDARHATFAGVFDFPDALSHEVDWDPHTLQEVQRPLVQGIRALLREVGNDALVFITADHGHLLQARGKPVRIRGSTDGVGYRAAHLPHRIEGEAAARIFQIEARKLRHNATGWFVFPRPGHALQDADDSSRRFRPTANYRHGGISLAEVVVPLTCLRHRSVKAKVRLTASLRGRATVGKAVPIEVTVAADGVLSSPVFVTADVDGVEPATVQNVGTVPQTVHLSYLPTSPGKRQVRFSALLAGEPAGEATLYLQVARGDEAEVDVARAKLAKLFGED